MVLSLVKARKGAEEALPFDYMNTLVADSPDLQIVSHDQSIASPGIVWIRSNDDTEASHEFAGEGGAT